MVGDGHSWVRMLPLPAKSAGASGIRRRPGVDAERAEGKLLPKRKNSWSWCAFVPRQWGPRHVACSTEANCTYIIVDDPTINSYHLLKSQPSTTPTLSYHVYQREHS